MKPLQIWKISAITIANNLYHGTGYKKENRNRIKERMESFNFYLHKEFTIHELQKENWGKDFKDGVMEDLYINKDFIPQKNPA